MKNVIKLSIISEVDDKKQSVLTMNGHIFKGENINGYDFECGNCSEILATNLFHEQILNVVLLCRCGKYNIVRLTWKDYIFKFLREKINYPVVIIGFLLMFLVSTNLNLTTETKLFVNIIIFLLSLNYKVITQVFREK